MCIILTQKNYINNIKELKLDKKEKTTHLSEYKKTAFTAKLGQLLKMSK